MRLWGIQSIMGIIIRWMIGILSKYTTLRTKYSVDELVMWLKNDVDHINFGFRT
jgi:hypothetical protein